MHARKSPLPSGYRYHPLQSGGGRSWRQKYLSAFGPTARPTIERRAISQKAVDACGSMATTLALINTAQSSPRPNNFLVLLFVLNCKAVFPVPDISCLRNVDYVLRDALDQIDNLLQTPRHYNKAHVKPGTLRILTHSVTEFFQ